MPGLLSCYSCVLTNFTQVCSSGSKAEHWVSQVLGLNFTAAYCNHVLSVPGSLGAGWEASCLGKAYSVVAD